jgi:thiol:disulfide interchange protein
MKLTKSVKLTIVLAVLTGSIFWVPALAQNRAPNGAEVLEAPTAKTQLYSATANAQEEINAALKRATHEHKRVLLVFGGNWCYDCHVLDRALHEGEAGKIMKASFELVHVDIGEGDKNLDLTEKYQVPLDKGVPALAVLNSDGKVLYSSIEGEFEAARTMTKKALVIFLERWQESGP